MSQCFNPYLPLWEYVPDGEPHLFEGRVYIYGSHDAAYGEKYCVGDYVAWSAPENDLTDWRYDGVIYRRTQDPSNGENVMDLWAPDVTRGPDGRYYLYYCFSFHPEIGVAVSDSPAGPFEFYGHVKYPEHMHGGKVLGEFMPFDPAVLTDDNGRVYLYYGFAPACEKEMKLPNPEDVPPEVRAKIEELRNVPFGENGMVAELEPDMVTLKETPRVCLPGGHHTQGTGFEGHGYFEAPSIRKINGKYYLVYSSHKSHELCYAVSDYPDRDFVYGGTIVSNGDVGLNGRTFPVNTMGNNHGGLVQANGEWYIFYHRQTHNTAFSRQACAEPISIEPDGTIRQVEITSCGLNGGPLKAEGTYPATICCNLTNGKMPHLSNVRKNPPSPNVNHEGELRFIKDITKGTMIGYKYFSFSGTTRLKVTYRGSGGEMKILIGEKQVGNLQLPTAKNWAESNETTLDVSGTHALYFFYQGSGEIDLLDFTFG